jgi:L-ribulose-5-phosphate 3-epimerase
VTAVQVTGRAANEAAAPIRWSYCTNGFANHRLADVLTVLSDLGYAGVALTLDHNHLDPFDAGLARRVTEVARRLRDTGLSVVIETGARYLLDPWQKHSPVLMSPDGRERRIDLIVRAVRIGSDLGAESVCYWSGAAPGGMAGEVAWELLADGCARILAEAERAGQRLGFEPEPGMLVDNLAGYLRLRDMLGAPDAFGLALDIGHCRCLEPYPVPDCVRLAGRHLAHVQLDDMRRGVHEHLEPGTGEIDFPPVLAALASTGYRGLVSVELPRHSHDAPRIAGSALRFLREAERQAVRGGGH